MNSRKFETNSFCVGGKHRSGTKKISGEITISKRTGREIELLVGKCVICNRKKSMIVSDNTIQAEGFGDFFKNLGKRYSMYQKRWQKMYSKILAELWILKQTLLQQHLLEILNM